MINSEIVSTIVKEWMLKNEGFFITDIHVDDSNSIVVEIDHPKGVTIDDCVELNQYIDSQLDRNIEDYELEVGSATLGQPFKVKEQYRKYLNEEVEVLTKEGKKCVGILASMNEEGFNLIEKKKVKQEGSKKKIEVEEDTFYPYTEIKYTKYLIRFK